MCSSDLLATAEGAGGGRLLGVGPIVGCMTIGAGADRIEYVRAAGETRGGGLKCLVGNHASTRPKERAPANGCGDGSSENQNQNDQRDECELEKSAHSSVAT